jgi:2-octaprenyl-6-methoxyphenol hydroxylase
LAFEGDSWVDIRDADGNKVASKLYKPGAEDTLSGKPPFKLVIGNAAQTLHPIAGQGFNLGLRDVATLAEVIADDCRARGADADPGDERVLAAYADWRRQDRRTVIGFTDGLVRLFGNPLPPVRAARALGLLAFDLFPPAKNALARLSMGVAGRVPRLARGLPL